MYQTCFAPLGYVGKSQIKPFYGINTDIPITHDTGAPNTNLISHPNKVFFGANALPREGMYFQRLQSPLLSCHCHLVLVYINGWWGAKEISPISFGMSHIQRFSPPPQPRLVTSKTKTRTPSIRSIDAWLLYVQCPIASNDTCKIQ